jgi:hypothetical protein
LYEAIIIIGRTRHPFTITSPPRRAARLQPRRFENVWIPDDRSGGMTYVIRDDGHSLPAKRERGRL